MSATLFQHLGLIAIGFFAGVVVASIQPSTQSGGKPREETESSDVQ